MDDTPPSRPIRDRYLVTPTPCNFLCNCLLDVSETTPLQNGDTDSLMFSKNFKHSGQSAIEPLRTLLSKKMLCLLSWYNFQMSLSSGSSNRVAEGARNMKSMRLPSVANIFMTYFYRAKEKAMVPSATPESATVTCSSSGSRI